MDGDGKGDEVHEDLRLRAKLKIKFDDFNKLMIERALAHSWNERSWNRMTIARQHEAFEAIRDFFPERKLVKRKSS